MMNMRFAGQLAAKILLSTVFQTEILSNLFIRVSSFLRDVSYSGNAKARKGTDVERNSQATRRK